MPFYQYLCMHCRRRFETFMSYSEYGTRAVRCPHCASENVRRRIGRVRVARADESRMEDLADQATWPAWKTTLKPWGA